MRTIIAGSRGVTQSRFDLDIGRMLWAPSVVLCGMARGVDLFGKAWAEKNGILVEEYPADWDRFGKSAGYRRNVQMSDNADALFAIWDGKSKGTEHMMNIAHQKGLHVMYTSADEE